MDHPPMHGRDRDATEPPLAVGRSRLIEAFDPEPRPPRLPDLHRAIAELDGLDGIHLTT